jgi:Domain of unknown function (DUF4333)
VNYQSRLDFKFDPKWRWSLALCCGLLTACSGPSEGDRMAQTIQQDVIRQGGNSLKTVVCPKEVKPQVGETLECTGELDTGYVFTIPVKWKDDKGGFTWEIPNAKGLLNLTKFEGMIQEGVKSEVGSAVARCGTTLYRAVRAGEKFDCQLAVKPGDKPTAKPGDKPEEKSGKTEGKVDQGEPPKPPKPDKIAVSVDADRNISWQRLIAGEPQKPDPRASPAATPASQAAASPTSAAATPASAAEAKSTPSATGDSGKPAPEAKSNAEEFLNQSGASNNFED